MSLTYILVALSAVIVNNALVERLSLHTRICVGKNMQKSPQNTTMKGSSAPFSTCKLHYSYLLNAISLNFFFCIYRISICIGTFGVCECVWRLVGAVWHSAVLCCYSGCNCHRCIWMHRYIYTSNCVLAFGLHCVFVIWNFVHCPSDLCSAAVQFLWLHWDAAQEVHTGRDDWREWAELPSLHQWNYNHYIKINIFFCVILNWIFQVI